MTTIADYRDACRDDGLPTETVPDFLGNGRDGVLTLADPQYGYLHHTVAKSLESVYYDRGQRAGWPLSEWRPEVPVPRANIYVARARAAGCRPGCPYDGVPHLVFTSNGKANHAGRANRGRIELARAGRITARTPDAVGLPDDYTRAGYESVGVEIDWAEGEDWPDDLLDVVARLMRLGVDTFNWPGLGCWINHRQATYRKTDLAYRGDLWARAARIGSTPSQEDDMPGIPDLNATGDKTSPLYGDLDLFWQRGAAILGGPGGIARGVDVRTARDGLAAAVGSVRTAVDAVRADTALQGDDEAKVLARLEVLRTELAELERVVLAHAAPEPTP